MPDSVPAPDGMKLQLRISRIAQSALAPFPPHQAGRAACAGRVTGGNAPYRITSLFAPRIISAETASRGFTHLNSTAATPSQIGIST